MASIEISTPLVTTGLGWLTSTIILAWTLSRRSKNWDEAERHQKALYGDPDKHEIGLIQRVADLEEERVDPARLTTFETSLTAVASRVKNMQRALNAHGSDEHVISEGVRKFVAEESVKAQHAAAEARKQILADQEQRFRPSHEDAIVVTRLEPIPRVDPTWSGKKLPPPR